MHKQDFHRDVAHGQSQAQDTSLGVGDYTQLGKVLGCGGSQARQRRANAAGKRGEHQVREMVDVDVGKQGGGAEKCSARLNVRQVSRPRSGTLFADVRTEVASSACIAAVPHLHISELIPHCFFLLHHLHHLQHLHHLHQVPQPLSPSLQVIIMRVSICMEAGPDGRLRVVERPRQPERSSRQRTFDTMVRGYPALSFDEKAAVYDDIFVSSATSTPSLNGWVITQATSGSTAPSKGACSGSGI